MKDGDKPLGHKAYGSIPHLKGSRTCDKDHLVNSGIHRICTTKARKGDLVIVMEKLDGSCCSVYREPETDEIIALTRSGYRATTSPFEQHAMFAYFVRNTEHHFRGFLEPGERIVGEWMAQAHGTRYQIPDTETPYMVFDIMKEHDRMLCHEVIARLYGTPFNTPTIIHCGGPLPIEDGMDRLGLKGFYGALDGAEGLVYRVERDTKVEILAKYVHPGKQDGTFLPELSGGEAVWNWKPEGWH